MWQTVEMMGYAHFSEKGYRIFVPLVVNYGYDFVAEKDGEFIKVNVKLAGLKSRADGNSWSISQAGGSFTNEPKEEKYKIDVYLAYLPEPFNKFVELPGDFFEGTVSKSKAIPRKLYMEEK